MFSRTSSLQPNVVHMYSLASPVSMVFYCQNVCFISVAHSRTLAQSFDDESSMASPSDSLPLYQYQKALKL